MNRRDFLGTWAALATRPAAGQASPGPIECRVVDTATGAPVAARVRLTDAAGNEVAPIGHAATPSETAHEGDVRFQSRRFCYVNGTFLVEPPALPLRYQVIKGYEYGIAEGELTAGQAGPVTIGLSPWSSISRQGWFGGDIHIHHISPKSCRLEMEAEDLHVANILTTDISTDQDQFEGRINAHSGRERLIYVNQEFRSHELGHVCLLNLKKLIEPVKLQTEHYPLHLGIYDRVHAQGGYVSWAHFPTWPGVESPLDVVMEKLDGLEILSVMEPRNLPIFMRKVVPEIEANDGLRQWYRYLNCGFRLTATAGTDKMTNLVTVGANRVFAKVDGPLTYQGWIDALRGGRAFISNSPLLSFTVNGRQSGDVLEIAATGPRVVEIQARAESQLRYHRLEIVVNGQVVADASPSGKWNRAEIRLELPLNRSCWIAARAVEDLKPYRDAGVDFSKPESPRGTLLGNYFGTRRPETVFAHTSPVYVILGGRQIRNMDDADYYIRYMDKAIEWLETEGNFARPSDKQASIAAFQQGRARWVERRRQAE